MRIIKSPSWSGLPTNCWFLESTATSNSEHIEHLLAPVLGIAD
jgi:hypothetical protein